MAGVMFLSPHDPKPALIRARHIRKSAVVAGAVTFAAGLAFLLQSQSALGPESSFMYSNPEWDINGKAMMLAGAATACISYMLGRGQR